MAHRKLQQEVDRVFKKINEGLDVFNTYYERHEACTNNPSQKDKLESDLKREVKKLQRLREQIKSWQSSPDIKDKDSLLNYRRSVEVAMEQYKAVEKASKEKAYSNNSLKKSENMDPQERERQEISDYLSLQIDELERQFEAVQIDIDRLLLLNKKKKTASIANDEKREKLRLLQNRYRWHQQQMELALRLLANEELDPSDVKLIQDDIDYFIKSNNDQDFIEDESIYDTLNLQSNEAIAHEVSQYFASQQANDNEDTDSNEPLSKDALRQSKKEQRKAEREAKKAAKAAAKLKTSTPVPTTNDIIDKQIVNSSPISTHSISSSSPINTSLSIENSKLNSVVSTAPTTATNNNNNDTLQNTEMDGPLHIHQGKNGTTTTSTLKLATVPIRPAGDMKWNVAASHNLPEKEKKQQQVPTTNTTNIITDSVITSSSKPSSNLSTPIISKSTIVTPILEKNSLYSVNSSTPNSSSSNTTTNVQLTTSITSNTSQIKTSSNNFLNQLNATKLDVPSNNNNNNFLNSDKSNSKIIDNLIPSLSTTTRDNEDNNEKNIVNQDIHLLVDDYESDITDDEIENEPIIDQIDQNDIESLKDNRNKVKDELIKETQLLLLPSGIQQFIIGSEIFNNNLNTFVNDLGGYRRSRDTCHIPRLDPVPFGVNPPTPLDAFRSTQQWDVTCCSLRDIILSNDYDEAYEKILENFKKLETFTLFYNYYFSVTPLEKKLAFTVLSDRNWKISASEIMWFYKLGEPKLTNPFYEIADYRIFSLEDWTVHEKQNFKLDFNFLKESTDINSNQNLQETETETKEEQSTLDEELSHGQQLLQQLNKGKLVAT